MKASTTNLFVHFAALVLLVPFASASAASVTYIDMLQTRQTNSTYGSSMANTVVSATSLGNFRTLTTSSTGNDINDERSIFKIMTNAPAGPRVAFTSGTDATANFEMKWGGAGGTTGLGGIDFTGALGTDFSLTKSTLNFSLLMASISNAVTWTFIDTSNNIATYTQSIPVNLAPSPAIDYAVSLASFTGSGIIDWTSINFITLSGGGVPSLNMIFAAPFSVAVQATTAPTPKPEMVSVQGGTLLQPSEFAGNVVSAFSIGKYEVMWGEWQEVRAWAVTNGYSDLANVGAGSADNHPVHDVNWYDVVKWSNAKSEKEGLTPVYRVAGEPYRTGQSEPTLDGSANGYRLPTEAEWEWAARGGVSSQGYIYSGSDDVDTVAWHWYNASGALLDLWGGRGTWPAGSKVPNELGIHDMSGNVWEWCEDLLTPNSSGVSGPNHAVRGGGWFVDAAHCAVVNRDIPYYDYYRHSNFGFRIARNASVDSDGDGLTDAWERGFGRYQIVQGNFTWAQAKADAESKGGHLATITSEDEQVLLRSLIPGVSGGPLTWLGATDEASEGVWKWVTAEAWNYTAWFPGRPDNTANQDHLLVADENHAFWDDFYGTSSASYLLEFGYPTDPLDPDSDDDGFNDKVESDAGSDPNNASSVPGFADSDGDGVNNYRENADGTDPNDPNSFNGFSKGLVAYYPFDGSLDDFSGNSKNLINHGATLGAGRLNQEAHALSLDVNSYVVSDRQIGISGNQHHTISFWIYLNSYNYGVGMCMAWGSVQSPGSAQGIYLDGRESGRIGAWGHYADLQCAGLGDRFVGSWHHVVYSYSGSVAAAVIYVDGSLVPSAGHVLNAVEDLNVTDSPLTIGSQTSWISWDGQNGLMDDVRVYNRALSAAEVAQLYTTEAGDLDSDGDGLLDIHETNTGTYVSPTDTGSNPQIADTDGDGFNDGVEVDAGSDPNSSSSVPGFADSDGDGVNNFRESADGTDPNDSNSFNPLSKGLVAYYPFNGNANDESGNSNGLTLSSYVGLSLDRHSAAGQALEIQPAPNNAVVADSDALAVGAKPSAVSQKPIGITGKSPRTVSFWALVRELPLWNEGTFLQWGKETSGYFGLQYCLRTARTTFLTENNLVWDAGYAGVGIKTSPDDLTHRWHHFTLSYDGSAAAFYVDGAEQTGSFTAEQLSSINTLATTLRLGNGINGSLDDIRVYSRALSSDEISDLYNQEESELFLPQMVEISMSEETPLGYPDYLPEKSVLLPEYFIAKDETTFAAWDSVVKNAKVKLGWTLAAGTMGSGYTDVSVPSPQHPVTHVNFVDVALWCNAASIMSGMDPCYSTKDSSGRVIPLTPSSINQAMANGIVWSKEANGYRLPTGDEWEVAARGGLRSQAYPWGNDPANSQNANWIVANGYPNNTTPVGTYPRNGFDLSDCAGNVLEITWDSNLSPAEEAPAILQSYVVRGGGWQQGYQPRITFGWDSRPFGDSSDAFGFRVARNSTPNLVKVQGGTLPQASGLAGTTVSTFGIGKYEVTWTEWQEVRAWALDHGYSDLAEGVASGNADPVSCVNQYDMVKWCNARSEKEGLSPVYLVNGETWRNGVLYYGYRYSANRFANGYRLPTEAEWEWAARGGVNSQSYEYSGSNDANAVAWFVGNSNGGTRAVGTKAPNELGIHDMSGNVWECVVEGFSGSLSRRIRGGGWNHGGILSSLAFRDRVVGLNFDQGNVDLGFRVARSMVLIPSDTDNDGVNDYRENADGTNPNDGNSFNPLSKGLVAYYPLNGSSADESGLGNHAVNFGAEITPDRFGTSASAFSFDGVSDYMDAPPLISDYQRNFTFSGWLKTTHVSSERLDAAVSALCKTRDAGDFGGPAIDFREGKAVFTFNNNRVFGPLVPFDEWEYVTGFQAADGQWRHYIMSINADGIITAFINGQQVASHQITTFLEVVGASPFQIGRAGGAHAAARYFPGQIDDVRVYNRGLTADEAKSLYQSESGNLDSDGDGIADVKETNTGIYVSPDDRGTDPYRADTDGDGLSDAAESNTGTFVSASHTGTSPLAADTNADGVSDGEAVTWNFNPLVDLSPIFDFLRYAVGQEGGRFGLFTQDQHNSSRTNGRTDVTGNPGNFGLFTQEQYDGNRAAGRLDVMSNPMSYGLYTSNSIMDLRMSGLIIQKQGTNATISFQPQTTTDLSLPFTNNGTPINHQIPMPGNKGFIRIRANP